MANVVRDPKEHPDAIVADFATPNPLVTFKKEDVAFTYGSKWKQRYFTKIGDDYFVFPAQWDVPNKTWRAYGPRPGTDWWTAFYPEDQMQRPAGPLCDGCHSVNYDVKTKQVTEWNVGCERCHGAGSVHVQDKKASTIVNPAKLDAARADDVCIQCHSQGRPRTNPVEGRYYDWAVGYQPGDRLADVWELEEHHLGTASFTHWPEGTAHKNRMQGNDFVQSEMYLKGVRCYACHDVHGTEHAADVRLPGNDVCLQCHSPQLQPGPRGTLDFHTQHKLDSEGSKCVACHMPAVEQTIANVNVRSHTFRFISPTDTGALRCAESLYVVSQGQGQRLGECGVEQMAERSAMARLSLNMGKKGRRGGKGRKGQDGSDSGCRPIDRVRVASFGRRSGAECSVRRR